MEKYLREIHRTPELKLKMHRFSLQGASQLQFPSTLKGPVEEAVNSSTVDKRSGKYEVQPKETNPKNYQNTTTKTPHNPKTNVTWLSATTVDISIISAHQGSRTDRLPGQAGPTLDTLSVLTACCGIHTWDFWKQKSHHRSPVRGKDKWTHYTGTTALLFRSICFHGLQPVVSGRTHQPQISSSSFWTVKAHLQLTPVSNFVPNTEL